jgi:hypothetical protein
MLNNSIRIRTTPDGKDKFLKVKLDQEFDFIEILSLKITQAEAYRNFCADYGVVVGRVFINNGFGIPNARVSIFIPIDDVDKNDPVINGLYPYEVVTDKDIDGKRYNLLPKSSETDNECYTPVGTFPNKREVLDDPEMGHVYCKYYKFTTSTNYAGDYMIFGVPVGNYTVHVDADISDIGIASQRPYDSISQGSPIQMFDSPTKFKGGTNLDRLIQVKTTNAGVNVQPFWGSVENCEIGISRIDLDLNYEIKPSAIFMGGVFGDSDNNSVNKNCRPRRKMGKICEQNTSEGTIEMIRETLDGNIEKLDIEGGRLIDDKGAWAYQIPMNLDYYYTNEFGELVLSEDPNKGIPTRASVRFKIAMDDTGGEGRLRTRANYLVPHNPNNVDEIDYEFGELTKDFSFRDLYWNKIYSVSNFISRYQRTISIDTVKNRNFVGLKDVDDCVGDKLPTPFNRVNVVFNPLFFVICLIMKIIEFIMTAINFIIIPIINLLVSIIRLILGALCSVANIPILKKRPFRAFLGWSCDLREQAKYIPCLYAKCPFDGSSVYDFAPGCQSGSRGFQAIDDSNGNIPIKTDFEELSNCIGASMARTLNLFQFDFYNDWLNGSLYYYLVKYKKRRRREKYCNYDCSDGRCSSSILVDTCYSTHEDSKSIGTNEGLIKKYNGELYYAPIIKNGSFKLYATEIINLGSVFKCDWQGVPKIQEFLVPTTYLSPPLIDECSDENPAILETTGQIDIGSSFDGLFFKISCAGLKCDERQTLNIRHACEFGVDLDEIEELDNGTIRPPNGNFGSFEINSEYGKYVRDTFFGLNNVTNNINVNLPYSTDFNVNNYNEYNFATTPDNGSDYVDFRDYIDNTSFSQPKHSFYFYFGIVPGAGGLEKMNANFFTRCFPKLTVEFFIRIDDTTAISQNTVADGTVTFTIISGVGPFSYVVSGPNYNESDTVDESNTPITLNGLGQGTYTINVTDFSGVIISQTFEISGPIPLYAAAVVTSTNSSLTAPYNGEITLISVGGGNGTYTATLYHSNGTTASTITCNANSANGNPSPVTQLPITFCGLAPDIAPNFDNVPPPPPSPQNNGYYMVVTDTSTPQQIFTIRNLTLGGVSVLNVQISPLNATCYDSANGSIRTTVSGGLEPYYTSVEGGTDTFNGPVVPDLTIGNYVVRVEDSTNPPQVVTQNIQLFSEYPEMKLSPNTTLLPVQCDPTKYTIYLQVINGGTGLNTSLPTPTLQNYTTRYPSNCYIQYNYDDAQNENNNLIWSQPPTEVTYLDNQFNIKLEIPSTTLFGTVKVRLTHPQGICGSNFGEDETEFDVLEMRLPPGPLIIDANGIDNSKQCLPNKFSFKFNISHLSLFQTYRAPYILFYEIANQSGIYSSPVAQYPTLITQNQQLITLNVPNTLDGDSPTLVKVRLTLRDNVGCVSNTLIIDSTPAGSPIRIPTQALGLSNNSWSITYFGPGAVGAPNTIYNKAYQIVGGLPPYTTPTGRPLLASPTSTSANANVAFNDGLTITVEDSVGCIITKNSG